MAKKYLDDTGLLYLWGKIKDKISSMLSAEAGKMVPYGYCQTAAGTKAKTVTVSPAVSELTTGLTIVVRFQYSNTIANPTLAVNGLTAKSIKRYGTTAPSTTTATSWQAGEVCMLTYNGSYWMLNNWNGGGGSSEPTISSQSVTTDGTGTWHYRTWASGWQEAWYYGSVTFPSPTSSGGFYRAVKNFALPISFADDASVLVSGAASAVIYSNGGLKTNGTYVEVQALRPSAFSQTTLSAVSIYVAGYGRS